MAEEEKIEAKAEIESTGDVTSLSEMFEDSAPEVKAEDKDEKGEPAKVEPEESKPEKEETPVEAKAEGEPPSPQEQGQLAAMLAERDKRKKAEAKVKELESRLEPETTPDPIEDPEGYAKYIEGKVDKSELQTRISLSRDVMSEIDPDYERLEGVFMSLVTDGEGNITNDSLVSMFQKSANPAKFARDHAKEHLRIKELSDPKYLENLKTEMRKTLLAEIAAEGKPDGKVSAVDMPDLTTATSVDSNSTPRVKNITLGELFPE